MAYITQVKKNMHDKLELHGTGKSYSKGVVERILHKMVLEGILKEDISKSDMFGSISSILKVVMYSYQCSECSMCSDVIWIDFLFGLVF